MIAVVQVVALALALVALVVAGEVVLAAAGVALTVGLIAVG
jgi:hypothetical protein